MSMHITGGAEQDDAKQVQVDAHIARIECALNSALNMVEGDGMPPDWDYLRLVRSQLPELGKLLAP